MTAEEARTYFIKCNENLISVAKDENMYSYERQEIEAVCSRRAFEANKLAIKALEEVEKHKETFDWCTGCKEYDSEAHCCHRWSKFINETVNEIKSTSNTGEWIPVTERLPELGEIVLIYDKAFGYLTAKYSEVVDDYDEKNTVFLTHYSISSDKWASMYPIAWMPLPEPYKAESEE